jgi:hypothetical protein
MTHIETKEEQHAREVVEKYIGGSSILMFDADTMRYFDDANIALYLCYLKRQQFIMYDHEWMDKFGYWKFSLTNIQHDIGYSIDRQEEILRLLQDLNIIDVVGTTLIVFNKVINNLLQEAS